MTTCCVSCGKFCTVSCTPDEYRAWQNGQLIQNAMPNVPKAERELLISGLCGECFDQLRIGELDQ